VNSPIASSSCASTRQQTGSGDFTFQDVLEDVSCYDNPDSVLLRPRSPLKLFLKDKYDLKLSLLFEG